MVDAVEPTITAVADALRIKVKLADTANYSKTRREPSIIVIHATHGAEGPRKDDDEAYAISKPLPPGKKRSFHYVVDSDSATRCVPDLLTAWHAGKTANARGIGVEICGSASQTRAQWLDPVSLSTLNIAARLVADLCKEHKIPATLLQLPNLMQKQRGITTHHLCSLAWHESTHWDPGPNFPLTEFIEAVRLALESNGHLNIV